MTKLILRVLGTLALILVLVVVAGTAYLAAPRQPGASRYLKFEGYILLPGHGLMNVMDYMTLQGRSLFVTSPSSGSIYKIALGPGGNPVTELTGQPRPHGVALVEKKNLAFATRATANEVDVISLPGLKLLKAIRVAADADGILYDAPHDLIYVVNGDPQLATLIDPESQASVGTIPLGGKPEFAAVDSKSGLVYQALESTDSVAAVDLGQRRVVGKWPLAGCKAPTGVAVDAQARRAFIVCGESALLVVFDLEKDRVVASVKIGTGPDAVAFDPYLHRIYATGLSGDVSVTLQKSADEYELLDKVSTHFAAHTLAVDPVTHKVYVAYASLIVAPRVAVFSPGE